MLLRAGASVALLSLLAAAAAPAEAAPSPPPSGIGSEAIFAIVVSPAYLDTGLVVVQSGSFGGHDNSPHLWVSHDGGATWQRMAATGWDGDRPAIGVDANEHETIYASSNKAFVRSDDYGATFQPAGPTGSVPATAPNYASSGEVAVPGTPDYVWKASGTRTVKGSGGAYSDYEFFYSPSYPATGRRAAALLSAIDSHGMPQVLRCDATLACSGAAAMPGATTFSAPAYLSPSSAFATDGVVFAQTGRGDYKSIDGGATFAPLAIAPNDGAAGTTTPMFALAPGYREAGPVRTAYAAVFQTFSAATNPHTAGGIFRSDDGGATWHTVGSPSPLDGGAIAVATAPDGRVFAGYLETGNLQAGAGLLCSTNGGAGWQPTCPHVGHWTPAMGHASPAVITNCNARGCTQLQKAAATPAANPSGSSPVALAGSSASRGKTGGGDDSPGGGFPVGPVAAGVAILLVAGGAGAWLRRRL